MHCSGYLFFLFVSELSKYLLEAVGDDRSQPSQDFENHSILPHGIGGGLQDGPPYSDTARVPRGLPLLVPLLARLLARLRSGGHFSY